MLPSRGKTRENTVYSFYFLKVLFLCHPLQSHLHLYHTIKKALSKLPMIPLLNALVFYPHLAGIKQHLLLTLLSLKTLSLSPLEAAPSWTAVQLTGGSSASSNSLNVAVSQDSVLAHHSSPPRPIPSVTSPSSMPQDAALAIPSSAALPAPLALPCALVSNASSSESLC